jgi:hypothetical protein
MSQDLQQEFIALMNYVEELKSQISALEKEVAEFRVVHVSRRGIPGPQGLSGVRGAQGPSGVSGQSIVGPKGDSIQGPVGPRGEQGRDSIVPGPVGPRGEQGRDSTIPGPAGPRGEQGLSGDIEEAKAISKHLVTTAIHDFRKEFRGIVLEELQTRGVLDEFGKAILIPGPIGATGPAGRNGADSTVPGPVGLTGPTGSTGRDGADSTVPGPVGPRGLQGDVGLSGRDSVVPGPAGKDGENSSMPGPQGKPGNIGAAIYGAEKAAVTAVLQLLKEKKLID